MKALKRPGSQPKPRRRAQLAELLLDVSNKIALAGNLNESFDVLAQIAASAVNADRASIFLSDAHTGELCTRAISGKFTRELRMLNHLGIAGHVYTGGRGIIVHDAYSDKRFNPDLDKKTGYVTNTVLCVPLRTLKGAIIGAAEVLNKKEGQFTEGDLELLEAVVRQAAISLENRRRSNSVRCSKSSLARLPKCSMRNDRRFSSTTKRTTSSIPKSVKAWALRRSGSRIMSELPERCSNPWRASTFRMRMPICALIPRSTNAQASSPARSCVF